MHYDGQKIVEIFCFLCIKKFLSIKDCEKYKFTPNSANEALTSAFKPLIGIPRDQCELNIFSHTLLVSQCTSIRK